MCDNICSIEIIKVKNLEIENGPYYCTKCGWVQYGCSENFCLRKNCHSWKYCQSKSKTYYGRNQEKETKFYNELLKQKKTKIIL